MDTSITRAGVYALCALLAACGGKKKDDHEDADTNEDIIEDALDDSTQPDAPDAPDVIEETAGDVTDEDAPLPTVDWALEYLGRYEHQDDGPDHIMDAALTADGTLLVASATGLAVVDRTAVESGTVTTHLGKYLTDTSRASNLDGAPPDSTYFPKFFHVAISGSTAYAATRYDGLFIMDITGSGSSYTVSEVDVHLRDREFTESVQVLGDRIYLAHHADGIEVMDIATDPQSPTTVSTSSDHIVDAWAAHAAEEGKIWVADGVGGVKLFRIISDELSYVTGDTVTTSPGTALDVTLQDDWVVAALGGQGIGVYEQWTAAQRNSYDLPGVCVDVEPLGDGRFAVACRSWLHVVSIDALGIARVLASARLHRRPDGGQASVHIGSSVTAVDGVMLVGGWDHLDAYRLVSEGTQPDIQLSGQRAHFGSPPANRTFRVTNGGFGVLEISGVECTEAALTCSVDDTSVFPGESTTLRIVSDGSASNVETVARVHSNDPDEPTLPVLVFIALDDVVDPLETAPDFTADTSLYDHGAGTFTDGTLTLGDLDTAGEVAHFSIFGSWCPACLPAVASMVMDVEDPLPTGATFFLVNQEEAQATVRHVMEKTYIPLTVVHDTDGTIGATLYTQPRVGLPFSRSFVVDADGMVTSVFTSYDPAAINDAIDDAL